MTALEAFEAVESYYLAAFKPRVDALQRAELPSEIKRLSLELLQVSKLKAVGDIQALNIQIDGHDQTCTSGTVLGSDVSGALGYDGLKRYVTCAKCLISLVDRRGGVRHLHLLERYELPFASATIQNCKTEILKVSDEIFAANGVFATAKQAAINNTWRL